MYLLRLLCLQRLLPQRQGVDGRDRHQAGRGDGPTPDRDGNPRDPHRGRRRGPSLGRHLRPRRARVLSAGRCRPARDIRLREHPAAPALVVDGLPQRPREQQRPGREALYGARQPERLRTLPRTAAQPLERPLVAGDEHRRLERRQLRPHGSRIRRRGPPYGGHQTKPIALAAGRCRITCRASDQAGRRGFMQTHGRSGRVWASWTASRTNRTCSTSTR